MQAKKSYGQHFLKDKNVVKKIVKAADLSSVDFVVEVGPGEGALTEEIVTELQKVQNYRKLVLVEADKELIPGLEARFADTKIIQADAARVDYGKLVPKGSSWALVGNLPYNAANAIIMNALKSPARPTHMIVMVQKEVADRMLARAGEMSLLSVAIQIYTNPKRLFNVKPGSFRPQPKVDSSVVQLDIIDSVDREHAEALLKIAKAGFSSRRKQLHKNLSAARVASSEKVKDALSEIGLSEKARAQELSVGEWENLESRI
ncbi:MAG: 16S rRNA (adenine(1518)-N(6)/adenine(1519)-N(6))-dimethyltransferase RsmA [bacterium]